jgi:plastocyanin
MRRSIGLLALSLVGLGLTASPAAAAGCDRTIAIQGSSFDPSAWTVAAQNDLHVCWHNGDPLTHTATADTGIFDTGFLSSGADFDVQLLGAGAYRYHCQIHGFMNGTITVRPHASAATIVLGSSFVLRIGDQGTFVPAPTWDVQRRRNDGPWTTIKSETTLASFVVKPGRAGTFRFRARTHLSGDVSGWSPARVVKVTA